MRRGEVSSLRAVRGGGASGRGGGAFTLGDFYDPSGQNPAQAALKLVLTLL